MKQITCWCLCVWVVVAVLTVLGLQSSVFAVPMTLGQEVTPADCTDTRIHNGTIVSALVDCEGATAPTVNPVGITNGRPVITGTFDASRTKVLRVTVAGRTYVLGVNSELQVSGNLWRLDLSQLTALGPGVYSVTVEVETTDGLLLRDYSTGELHVSSADEGVPSNPVESEHSNSPGAPGAPSTGLGRVFQLSIVVPVGLGAIVVLGVVITLLKWYRYRA